MNNNRVLVLSVFLAAGLLASISVPFARADDLLPGITGKDEHPNGCVDCHVKVSDKQDFRLVNLPALVKGHPDISKIVKKIPDSCELCHKGTGKTPALANAVHKVHYQEPANNHFVTEFKGQCLNCHQLNMTNGDMKVKSGPANW